MSAADQREELEAAIWPSSSTTARLEQATAERAGRTP